MKYTKENIHQGVEEKINSLPISEIDKRFLLIKLKKYPQEIEQNVLEWVNDVPLTDIDCYGESIVRVMRLWGFSEKDIPQLICGFMSFKNSNWQMPNYIWQAVTGLQVVYD